jgi:hypothetical protein
MRTLLISLLALSLASFAAPSVASAQTCGSSCTGSCVWNDDMTAGICIGSSVSTSPANPGGTVSQSPANPGTTLMNPLRGGATLQSFLASILAFVVRIGAIIVVLMLVYVGYLFVVAQGSDSKLSEAKKALLWTLIGALVLLGAQAIANGIQATVQALSAGT